MESVPGTAVELVKPTLNFTESFNLTLKRKIRPFAIDSSKSLYPQTIFLLIATLILNDVSLILTHTRFHCLSYLLEV